MSTRAKGTETGRKARRVELPSGTEVMLGPSQFAAAINRSRSRFNQLVNLEIVPPPDGLFQGDRFWLQSTVNRFIREQTVAGADVDGRGISEEE